MALVPAKSSGRGAVGGKEDGDIQAVLLRSEELLTVEEQNVAVGRILDGQLGDEAQVAIRRFLERD